MEKCLQINHNIWGRCWPRPEVIFFFSIASTQREICVNMNNVIKWISFIYKLKEVMDETWFQSKQNGKWQKCSTYRGKCYTFTSKSGYSACSCNGHTHTHTVNIILYTISSIWINGRYEFPKRLNGKHRMHLIYINTLIFTINAHSTHLEFRGTS